MVDREDVSLGREEPLEEEAGVVFTKVGPGSLAGVEGPRAAWGGPCWSPIVLAGSGVNLRIRSLTEPVRWNGEGPLASGVDSRRDRRAVSGKVGTAGLPQAWESENRQYLVFEVAGGG